MIIRKQVNSNCLKNGSSHSYLYSYLFKGVVQNTRKCIILTHVQGHLPSRLSSFSFIIAAFFNEQQKKNTNTRFHLSMQVYSNLLLKPSLHFHMLVVFILVLI